jgi:sulfur-oxidizing protein SoxA
MNIYTRLVLTIAITTGLLTAAGLQAAQLKSGYEFISDEAREMQDDEFMNPGYAMVERGSELFHAGDGGSQTCASCHGEGGEKLAPAKIATYPVFDEKQGKPLSLQHRIHLCSENSGNKPMKYDSNDALALETFVRNLAKGEKVNVSIDGPAKPYYENGKAMFNGRSGQMNMSCQQCHEAYSGMRLRAQVLSQGHSNGFPTYRLKNQRVNGLHERFRQCQNLLRAQYLKGGADEYVDLELYLHSRGNGLPIETPAVRF